MVVSQIETVDGETRISPVAPELARWVEENEARIARAKFGSRYDEINRKYGAIEVVWNRDCTDILSIKEPLEYLKESDRLQLERFGAGVHGLAASRTPLSGAGLRRLSEAIYANSVAEWERFRTDPQYVYTKICEEAQHAPETLPDTNGNAPTIQELLSRPAYVCMRFRYMAHNILLDIGSWDAIRAYFSDIEKLDEKHGRYGALVRRQFLMSQVRKILESIRQLACTYMMGAISVEPSLKKYFVRAETHPDYAGAIIEGLCTPEMLRLADSGSLLGALLRAEHQLDDLKTMKGKLLDVAIAMDTASEAEKAALSPALRDAWANLEIISDIIALIGDTGENWQNTPDDKRYAQHGLAGVRSATIFRAAAMERHVKSVESLKSESVLRKVWAEIEKVSMKKEKMPIEKVAAFTEVKPLWVRKPTEERRRPRPSTSAQAEETTVADVSTPTSNEEAMTIVVEPPLTAENEEPTEHVTISRPTSVEVATGSPVAVPSPEHLPEGRDLPVGPCPSEESPIPSPSSKRESVPEAPQERPKAPKVKTKGKPDPRMMHAQAPGQEARVEPVGIWFYVGKKIYTTFEHLLIPKTAPMDWVDFEKALTMGCGFAKVPTSGSAIIFVPQDTSNSPFFVHRPHGSEMTPGLVKSLGKRLKTQYDWTLARFSPTRRMEADS